jgi:hypothetical protein
MNKKSTREKNPMIRFEPGPERCNGYFQISWTPSKIDSKQQLIHACIFYYRDTMFTVRNSDICIDLDISFILSALTAQIFGWPKQKYAFYWLRLGTALLLMTFMATKKNLIDQRLSKAKASIRVAVTFVTQELHVRQL